MRGRHLDTRLLYKNFYMFASVAMLDGCQEVGRRRIQLNRKNPSVIASEEIAPALKSRADVTRSAKRGYQWPYKKDSCPENCFWKDVRRMLNILYHTGLISIDIDISFVSVGLYLTRSLPAQIVVLGGTGRYSSSVRRTIPSVLINS